MLIASLLPLLNRYSLGLDLMAGPDDAVTLTIIPRRIEGATHNPDHVEMRPISITASAAEIDAELAKGKDGALGQLIAARKTLGDQIAQQRQATDDARNAASVAAKAQTAQPRVVSSGGSAKTPAPTNPPADARSDEPASLF